MLLVTPVCPVTSEGDDESWAHSRVLTVLSSVPSSTDDGDPKCLEEWMEILATSRHFSPTQRLPKGTESNPKPRTDRKADSEGAGGGLGEEGDVTGLPKKLSNLKGAGMGDNTPHWFESMPTRRVRPWQICRRLTRPGLR